MTRVPAAEPWTCARPCSAAGAVLQVVVRRVLARGRRVRMGVRGRNRWRRLLGERQDLATGVAAGRCGLALRLALTAERGSGPTPLVLVFAPVPPALPVRLELAFLDLGPGGDNQVCRDGPLHAYGKDLPQFGLGSVQLDAAPRLALVVRHSAPTPRGLHTFASNICSIAPRRIPEVPVPARTKRRRFPATSAARPRLTPPRTSRRPA